MGRERFLNSATHGCPGQYRVGVFFLLWLEFLFVLSHDTVAQTRSTLVHSPDRRNCIEVTESGRGIVFLVKRDQRELIGPSRLGLDLAGFERLDENSRIVDVQYGEVDKDFQLQWGKTSIVDDCCDQLLLITCEFGGG